MLLLPGSLASASSSPSRARYMPGKATLSNDTSSPLDRPGTTRNEASRARSPRPPLTAALSTPMRTHSNLAFTVTTPPAPLPAIRSFSFVSDPSTVRTSTLRVPSFVLPSQRVKVILSSRDLQGSGASQAAPHFGLLVPDTSSVRKERPLTDTDTASLGLGSTVVTSPLTILTVRRPVLSPRARTNLPGCSELESETAAPTGRSLTLSLPNAPPPSVLSHSQSQLLPLPITPTLVPSIWGKPRSSATLRWLTRRRLRTRSTETRNQSRREGR
mmetsp:Transcript_32949/g.84410  ORF Transcript_32949/g.84410 Transcript_32949/m.84410 type:complete len:272 (-) Transcript_32949:1118-1933(-)